MANRRFNNQQFTMAPGVVGLFGHVTFGSSGAPTLDAPNSKGIVSITRNSAGNYTVVLGTSASSLDTYFKLLMVNHVFLNSSAPAAPGMFIVQNNVSNPALANLIIQFNSAGSATDPASGEQLYLEIDLKNSSAP